MFRFTGGVLNTKNVLIKNILANNSMKYNKSEPKAFFLINESVAEIQNILIKDSVAMSSVRPKGFSAVIIVRNSVVQIINMKMIGNSFRNFAQANKSYLCFENMTLIENNVTDTLFRVVESNVTLHEIKLYRNKIGCLVFINLKSKVLINNNSLTGNEIFKATFSISRSVMKLNNTNFHGNKIKRLMLGESQSQIDINNVTFTNNHAISDFCNISRESKLEIYNAKFLKNNSPILLHLSSSDSIIKNNTLLENTVSQDVYIVLESSTIQLNHIAFTRNKLRTLLAIQGNSSAIIQSNTLLENNISASVYHIEKSSTIQLIYVILIRNILLSDLLYMISRSSAKLINNRIIGNSLHQMFFAHLSYFEIDTIFIKNNTFSQLIRVVECNVSFESMKIRGNNVINDMIYVENSAGKMANTHIKNSDNFASSAFTTRWTYLGNRYFPFEITNLEIIWKNELAVTAKPVIHLSGNISLSNVKLLVTSLFETEILKYSTKDMTMFGFFDGLRRTFPNIYIISSLFIGCTKGSVKHIKRAGSFRCIPCARGTYTLNNDSLNTSLSFTNIKMHEKTNFTCLDCPVEANCTASIKSKSNFYGYRTKEQELKFLPCPRGFCCIGNQCNTIKSCKKNRAGTLCGSCIESYVESFISTDCISIHSCQNFTKF